MYLTATAEETFAQAFIREVNNDLNDVKHSFIRIGFRLREADEFQYYKELGYQNITELAEAEFGFKKTTTYELMNVHELAHDPDCRWNIADKYDKYSYSQLLALTYAKYVGSAFWNIVQPTDSVRKLKRFVSIWNEEYRTGCGYHPELKTVDEYLKAYDEKHTPKQEQTIESEYAGQLRGQIAMSLQEPAENEEESYEPAENFSERSEKFEQEADVQKEAVAPMTDIELMEYVIKQGSSYIDGKFRILNFYNSRQPTMNLFKNYVMTNYGSGYRTGDKNYQRVEYDGNNLTIMRISGGKLVLSWGAVAGNISRLITVDKYLSDEEKDKYLQWKEAQQKLTGITEESERSSNVEVLGQEAASSFEVNFSERSENSKAKKSKLKDSNEKSYMEYLRKVDIDEFVDLISEWVSKMPDTYCSDRSYKERINKWLFCWLISIKWDR